MKLVTHPRCARCDTLHPGYESELLGVRMCTSCLLEIANWMSSRGLLLDSHILVTELFSGVFESSRETASHMPVYVRVPIEEQRRLMSKGFTYSGVKILSVEKYQTPDSGLDKP
jgi:hypothetical protein